MENIHRQKGITLLGFIIVAAVVSFFALVGIKIFPLYMESFGVTQSLTSVVNQPNAAEMSPRELQRSFLRHAQINSLYRFNDGNIRDHMTVSQPARGSTVPRTITFAYEARTHMFGKLDIVLVYEEVLELGAN